MNDERYVFVQDTKEKKSTARSARSKRTHTGKGGSVKLPSDYMTKKEIRAMNGECKSYRLNEPMKWKEFKAMPDDLKVTYIKILQQKYNVPCTQLGEMFGVNRLTVSKMLKELNIEVRSRGRNVYDKDGWFAFVNGIPSSQKEEPVEEPVVEDYEPIPDNVLAVTEETGNDPHTIPMEGNMTFMCNADSALETVKKILGSEKVRITISWEAVND